MNPLFFLVLSPLSVIRFDISTAVLAFAGAKYWFEGRRAIGGCILGIGTLAKVYPGMIAGPALTWEVSRPGRMKLGGVIALGTTVIVGLAVWMAIGRDGMVKFLEWHARRGLEIYSIYSGILLLIGRTTGAGVFTQASFGSLNTEWPPWSGRIAMGSIAIQKLAALFWVMWRFERPFRVETTKAGLREDTRRRWSGRCAEDARIDRVDLQPPSHRATPGTSPSHPDRWPSRRPGPR